MSVYAGLIRLVAVVMMALGVAMIVIAARHGGGVGLLLGALFIAAGVGRLVMLKRRTG